MTQKAIDRLSVIQQAANRQLRQREAAVQLGLSIRQVKRLDTRFRQEGPPGLVSRHLGRRPGNALSKAVRQEIMGLVHERYADFGPTLACEKLVEQHGYRLSVETLRQWIFAEGLWKPKKRKAARIHQRRPRRPCPGERVQIDGSPHDWFEGRGPCCTLIVFIDDATSKLMALHFVPAETTWAYADSEGLSGQVRSSGGLVFRQAQHLPGEPPRTGRRTDPVHPRPQNARHRTHPCQHTPGQGPGRTSQPDPPGSLGQGTASGRHLALDGCHAVSAQPALRQEAANAFLPTFMQDYNRRFAKSPQNPADAHRPVLHSSEELDLILSLHATRKLSKNLTFQFKNREYQLTGQDKGYRLRGAQVTVCEAFDDTVTVLYKGQTLSHRVLSEGSHPFPLMTRKACSRPWTTPRHGNKPHPKESPTPITPGVDLLSARLRLIHLLRLPELPCRS